VVPVSRGGVQSLSRRGRTGTMRLMAFMVVAPLLTPVSRRVIGCGDLRMHQDIGGLVLGCLTALFGGYGARELVLAFRTHDVRAWSGRAVMATLAILVTALFAFMTAQTLA
jgi:hypothetical protein